VAPLRPILNVVKVEFISGSSTPSMASQLVLVFDDGKQFGAVEYDAMRSRFPDAHIVGCSTAGAIESTNLRDDVVAAAIHFERTRLKLARVHIASAVDSERAGAELGALLDAPDLVHVFVVSDGLNVNGTPLVRGLLGALGARVSVSGGLAADAAFARTTVIADRPPETNVIAALGFYGDSLRVGCGSLGGWDPFGPERLITRSRGNVLLELDHRPALELYRRYLGEHAAGLPASGLLFPLSVRAPESSSTVVRTILGMDEAEGSITFAGDMVEGQIARLMKANFDRLVDGAHGAAAAGTARLGCAAELAILVSCAGRRLVLQQRTEDELEAVREVVGGAAMMGFYSLGELGPAGASSCELHNQTMTITTLAEV
jgi:hypothetical protein